MEELTELDYFWMFVNEYVDKQNLLNSNIVIDTIPMPEPEGKQKYWSEFEVSVLVELVKERNKSKDLIRKFMTWTGDYSRTKASILKKARELKKLENKLARKN